MDVFTRLYAAMKWSWLMPLMTPLVVALALVASIPLVKSQSVEPRMHTGAATAARTTQLLPAASVTKSSKSASFIVKVNWRNRRPKPTTVGNKPIGHLKSGDKITVIGKVLSQDPYHNHQNVWYKLAAGGYVWAAHLPSVNVPVLAPARKPTPVRSAPRKAAVGSRVIPASTGSCVRPATGAFTSGFGMRWGKLHAGIDIANRLGTPIRAAKSGKVIASYYNVYGYGNMVKIQHAGGVVTLYGHMTRRIVRPGQMVKAGQQIGLMGATGDVTGVHVHFEVRPNGVTKIDPRPWLRRCGVRV